MKKVIFSSLFFLFATKSFSQKLPWFMDRDTVTKAIPSFIWIISGTKDVLPGQYDVLANDIDSLHQFSAAESLKLFGLKNKYGVVIFWCKRRAKMQPLTSIDSVLALYKLSINDKRLPVYMDSILAYPRREKYVNLTKIISVKVETEFVSDIKFINIITSDPPLKPKKLKPGEFLIR